MPATKAAQFKPPKSLGVDINLFTNIALSLIISYFIKESNNGDEMVKSERMLTNDEVM